MTRPLTSGEQALILSFLLDAGFPVGEATELIERGMNLDAAKELAGLVVPSALSGVWL